MASGTNYDLLRERSVHLARNVRAACGRSNLLRTTNSPMRRSLVLSLVFQMPEVFNVAHIPGIGPSSYLLLVSRAYWRRAVEVGSPSE